MSSDQEPTGLPKNPRNAEFAWIIYFGLAAACLGIGLLMIFDTN
jgi:hypothetical protein